MNDMMAAQKIDEKRDISNVSTHQPRYAKQEHQGKPNWRLGSQHLRSRQAESLAASRLQ
jgi:hypothetical protein